MKLALESYPGSKGASGAWQKILSEMPAHRGYIELCLGHGWLLRHKRPAEWDIGIDIDAELIAYWRRIQPGAIAICGDGIRVLSSWAAWLDPNWLIYVDPPYLRSTRTRSLYRCEMETPAAHTSLLTALLQSRCRVMISGYWSSLYATMLEDWRSISYQTMTRGGPRREYLWMNFPAGLRLHDTRFIGSGFRERERIKRKKQRWASRLAAMSPAERQAVREALAEVDVSADIVVAGDVRSPSRMKHEQLEGNSHGRQTVHHDRREARKIQCDVQIRSSDRQARR